VTHVFVTLVMAVVSAWGALALWYQAPGARGWKSSLSSLWVAFGILCLAAVWAGWFASGVCAFAAAFAVLLIWWRSLSPSNDRDWADDVARVTHGTIEGNHITLYNVRNFEWRTAADYTQRWETRRYDLERLVSLDMIMSYWSGHTIAHTLISFGFADGDHVVFSVEVRRERTEAFSEIGGFFKEFELSVIAAEERDIVRLRTNIRRERTYLYRLRIGPSAMRALFLAYVEEANSLVNHPRFYHTLTGNCTILIYKMLRRIVGPLPLSYRLWLSGYMPEYVYSVGGLDTRYPLEDLRRLGYISDRGRSADQSPTFSEDIRRGIPPL
jgi:Domain of unknown function (DUF4105)